MRRMLAFHPSLLHENLRAADASTFPADFAGGAHRIETRIGTRDQIGRRPDEIQV